MLEPNTGYIFLQNNQQANEVEGEQQSENALEVIKNSNQQSLNMAENDMRNNTDRGGCPGEENNTLRQLLNYSLNY